MTGPSSKEDEAGQAKFELSSSPEWSLLNNGVFVRPCSVHPNDFASCSIIISPRMRARLSRLLSQAITTAGLRRLVGPDSRDHAHRVRV